MLRYAHDVGSGIYTIDTGFHRPNFDASYLITQNSPEGLQAAFVDVGTNYSAPRLMATLEDLGLTSNDVQFVILTHVHLDHAGGAGEVMRLCPNAKLVVHPRGARHMVDPSALRAGAVGVYGEESVQKEYGNLLPIDQSRVIEAPDGTEIDLAGRKLVCLDTPGHAKHHITIWDELSKGAFTGDTFGLSYREFDTSKGAFIMPTTTPVQFDPDALRVSIAKIMAKEPRYLFPTHYSRVENVEYLHGQFIDILDQVEKLGNRLKNAENRHEMIKKGLFDIYESSLRKHGSKLSRHQIEELLALDVELNAQGMGIWLG